MSIATLPAPTLDDVDEDDDNVIHIYCCNPDRALCGADVADSNDLGDDADGDSPRDCPLCVLAEDQDTPCRTRCARFRWWRR